MKKADYIEKYGVEAYKRKLERGRQYKAKHKEKLTEQKKQYDAEHREQKKQYRAEHKEEKAAYNKQYRATPIGRANNLAAAYRTSDKKYNRGICTITKEWIVDNIFTKSCIYCGESDWKKLGCDRIDNTKPHTIDNVVCCCGKCNVKRKAMDFKKFMVMKKKETA